MGASDTRGLRPAAGGAGPGVISMTNRIDVSELIINCIETNGVCPGVTLLSIRVALYIRTPNVMTNRLDMGRDHDCFLVETNVPCEHNNSARRASPPLNDVLYWSEPQLKIFWYCGM